MGSILEDELVGALNEEQHDCLSALHTGAETLLSHVNDLLDIGEIVAGRSSIHPEKIDFSMLVADALEFLKSKADQHRQVLLNEVPLEGMEIVADPQRIH